MATRSTIAVELPDGKVMSIYCHWDGYLSYNGKILFGYYNNIKDVIDLISNGDISSLGEYIHPKTENHSFDYPEKGCTVYFGRDRNEDQDRVKPVIYESFDAYKDNMMWQEYNYIFRDGQWFFYDYFGDDVTINVMKFVDINYSLPPAPEVMDVINAIGERLENK